MHVNRIKLCREAELPYGNERITKPEQVAKIIGELTKDAAGESFYAIAVDTKNVILSIHLIAMGGMESVGFSPRDIFTGCLLAGGSGVILAHNHPSGDPEPSKEDRLLTDRIKEGCSLLGLRFLDHIIVGSEDNFFSFSN